MIKAVILNLDDTFYLTEQATFDMENEALVSMGRSPMKREAHRANWGKPLFEAILERSPDIDVEAFRVAYKRSSTIPKKVNLIQLHQKIYRHYAI